MKRTVWLGAGLYALLSVTCFWLSTVEYFPPTLERIAGSVIPYFLFSLGPPGALLAGVQGLWPYLIESGILVALIGLCVKLFRRGGEGFGVVLLVIIGFWFLCGFTLVYMAI